MRILAIKKLFLKNLVILSENDCFSVTRWTKDQFIRFSKYITSIKDNKHRSKEQLIALYKYWLWKGTDQSTLSLLFNFNTNQRQISDYLEQIRIAIFKDFVPFYLGSNKSREFFLKHNTTQSQELFNLDDQTLCLIADGTYTRLEKSRNNEFHNLK